MSDEFLVPNWPAPPLNNSVGPTRLAGIELPRSIDGVLAVRDRSHVKDHQPVVAPVGRVEQIRLQESPGGAAQPPLGCGRGVPIAQPPSSVRRLGLLGSGPNRAGQGAPRVCPYGIICVTIIGTCAD